MNRRARKSKRGTPLVLQHRQLPRQWPKSLARHGSVPAVRAGAGSSRGRGVVAARNVSGRVNCQDPLESIRSASAATGEPTSTPSTRARSDRGDPTPRGDATIVAMGAVRRQPRARLEVVGYANCNEALVGIWMSSVLLYGADVFGPDAASGVRAGSRLSTRADRRDRFQRRDLRAGAPQTGHGR